MFVKANINSLCKFNRSSFLYLCEESWYLLIYSLPRNQRDILRGFPF